MYIFIKLKKIGLKKFLLLIFLLFLILFVVCGLNNTLEVSRYTVLDANLPSEFNGFKIVHLSDLHGKNYGKNQSELIAAILAEKPDAVFFTGDMIDKIHDSPEPVLDLLKALTPVVPVYGVTGNHEINMGSEYTSILSRFMNAGLKNMEFASIEIKRGEQSIWIGGMGDLPLYIDASIHNINRVYHPGEYNILLFHRANAVSNIQDIGFNLIFSGHVHGGQVRLPFIGGIFSPDRVSLFPEHDSGVYELNDVTKLIVSRGLSGNFPLPRIYNRPDLVSVTLERP